MRDIFEDIRAAPPRDPVAAARRSLQPSARRRFYAEVGIAEGEGGCALLLDGRPVKTPARRTLSAPTRALAEALASEWQAQRELIEPASMPITRLANSIIDGVADNPAPVATEVAQYLATDLVLYRATSPRGLVERQAQAWDPLIAWARETFDAPFVAGEGLVFIAQPETALAAAGAVIPRGMDTNEIWRLGALHSVTTLTGSALIALAVLRGRLSAAAAWAAAHVDEDWNMEAWGRDDLALERRAFHFTEMQAAARMLERLRD